MQRPLTGQGEGRSLLQDPADRVNLLEFTFLSTGHLYSS